jgi:hypothetical protein
MGLGKRTSEAFNVNVILRYLKTEANIENH